MKMFLTITAITFLIACGADPERETTSSSSSGSDNKNL